MPGRWADEGNTRRDCRRRGGATLTGLVNASQPRWQSAATQAAPRTLIVRSTQYGRVLFDGRSRVLYGFTRDRRGGPSRCYGAAPALGRSTFARNTAAIRVGSGVKKSLIGRTRRRDGRLQLTYNGWPLYYYAHEARARCDARTWTSSAASGSSSARAGRSFVSGGREREVRGIGPLP